MRTELPGTSNGVSDDQEGANLEPGWSWPGVEGPGLLALISRGGTEVGELDGPP